MSGLLLHIVILPLTFTGWILGEGFSTQPPGSLVTNPSFEIPEKSLEDGWHPDVDGWETNQPIGTTWQIPWAEPSPASDGEQYMWGGDSDGFELWQNLGTLRANQTYDLLIDLHPVTLGTTRASIFLERTGGDSTTFDTKQFHPIDDPLREDFLLPDGQWTTVALSFKSSDFPNHVGLPFRLRIAGARMAADNVRLNAPNGAPRSIYVSSSEGNDLNNGTAPETPIQTLAHLASLGPFNPGENIYLKAGDEWTEGLNIRGKGTSGTLITLTSYGDGPRPVIKRLDFEHDVCLTWNNASHVRIAGIECRDAKIGIYLRYEYTDFGSENVLIEDCYFENMPDPALDPSVNNFELAWSDAIFVGGQAWQAAEQATRLDGLTVRNCVARECAHLFGMGWFYPLPFRARIRNLLIEDCVAYDCLSGSFHLIGGVDGGVIRRVHAIGGGGQNTWSGTTLGFIQGCSNVLIEECEFAFIDREQSADGSGMDFEGDTDNVTFRNNTIHNCDSSAFLVLSTMGPNTNLTITDNVVYNNSQNPWNDDSVSEFGGGSAAHTGTIANNSIYRGSDDIAFFTPRVNWNVFNRFNNIEADYSTVSGLSRWWDWDNDSDTEGWDGFNDIGPVTVAGGNLSFNSTGPDPYLESASTWYNLFEHPYVRVRMSASAGEGGQVFFLTERDQVWNPEKSVSFNLITDGVMRDYWVDLRDTGQAVGVIRQLRLDPSTASGASIQIDLVAATATTDPSEEAPLLPLPAPLEAVFTSIGAEDGMILETSQTGQTGGTVDVVGTLFRIGDDEQNRSWRTILSFDTSTLPDDAEIVQATLSITRIGGMVGQVPIGTPVNPFGGVFVDIAEQFGGASTLVASDWQATAAQDDVSRFAYPAFLSGMTVFSRPDSEDNVHINKTGRTQFRIRYENEDNNNSTADYTSYATGDYGISAQRPQLKILYRVP
jgi:hypothetical protein